MNSNLPIETQLLIAQASERLHGEFAGMFSTETIERFIAETQTGLEERASVLTWLPVLIERFARDRLRALARIEGRSADTRPAVLFLCVHNAGRSQMAAGWLRHLAGGAVDVYSGGSEPGTDVNRVAVEAMAEVGIDIGTEFPRRWTDEIVRAADVVVTMGCGDACPVFPGKRYEDWELADRPESIERGLATLEREYATDIGPVDLLCRDADGQVVAVEIKRKGEIDGVEQLTRYLDFLNRQPALAPVRGILVATSVTPQARTLAADRGIGWVEVDYERLKGIEGSAPRLFEV